MAAILVLAGYFRLTGSDWDQGQHLHPDERFLTMVETALQWPRDFPGTYFDEARSTLNPRNVGHKFFVYGDFPVILVKALSLLLDRSTYDQVHLVGRTISAIFDLGTLLVLFLLANQLYRDHRIALLAAALYAMAPLAIQQAHFFVVDNFSAFFVCLALWSMARAFRKAGLVDYLLAGACIGLALASKISVYSLVLLMPLLGAYHLFVRQRRAGRPKLRLEQVVQRLAASAISAFLVFRIFQPYAFQGPEFLNFGLSKRWLDNALEAREWVSGDRDAPFAHQWTNRTALLFPLENMLLWGMGVPLGLAAWAGWALATWQLAFRQRWVHLLPVAWVAVLFGLLGTQWVKSIRYFLPIYPVLILLGSWLLVWLWDRAAEKPRLHTPLGSLTWTPVLAGLIGLATVGGTLFYALAFTSIYTRPHTRVEASRWIYANLPPGTAIANETPWDDGLPLRVDGNDGFGGRYTALTLDITAEDSPEKLRKILDVLDRTEYVLVSSNRQYDALARLPQRFPLVIKYYQALFGGELGFERVAEFASYPRIFGLELPDQRAEEAWTVYDHPRVQIFRKQDGYSRARSESALGSVDWERIVQLTPRQASQGVNALMLSPEAQRMYQAAGTWRALFRAESLAARYPVAFWALALLLIGMVGLPYAWLAADSLPDRGLAFARPLSLLLLGWSVWLLASLGLVPFSLKGILLCAGLVALGGAVIAISQRTLLFSWLRTNWRLALAVEALFWGGFGLFVAIRWANPDLWHPTLGGEKPMDFAYLNAVTRSVSFPPYDPWFAGGYINYYYFGFVLVGTLIKLTGVVPAVAYNLAIATFFGFLAAAAFGATLALTGPVHRRLAPGRTLVVALAGALFVAVVGNLRQLTLWLEGFYSLSSLQFNSPLPGLAALAKAAHGFFTGFLAGRPLPFRIEWWYWNATRVIDHPSTEAGPITELPFFSFLFADLHAHVMALPYTLVAIALALALVRQPTDERSRLARPAHLLLLALVVGALWPMNSWDFPTYALLVLAALAIGAWQRGKLTIGVLAAVVGRWGLVLLLAYAFFLPFHRYYGTAVSGLEPWKGSQTGLGDYLTIHGFFLAMILSALMVDFWVSRDLNALARLTRLGLRSWRRPARSLRLLRRFIAPSDLLRAALWGLGASGALALALVALGKLVPGLVVSLLTLTLMLFFRRAARGQRPRASTALWQMSLLLFAAGLALTLAVEFVVLKNIDIGRMNTVFKFYLQTWVLWALAAAASIGFVWRRLPRIRPAWRLLWRLEVGLLLAAALLYPLTSTGPRIRDRFEGSTAQTLDGLAFMEQAVHRDHNQQITLAYDHQAMAWLRDNVAGTPVIAEVNTAPTLYGWGSRFASYTGNPTVIGWDWHQRQQRSVIPARMVTERLEDIKQAYSTRDANAAHRIFSRYGVQYFIVGQLERAYYPAGQNKWREPSGKLWELIYENPGTQIYRVFAP